MDNINNIPTTWRYNHIRNYIWENQQAFPHLNNFYQFGVWTCRSMVDMIRMNLNIDKYFGFDSFEGLPDEPNENIYEDIKAYGITDWCKGMYSSKDWFKVNSIQQAMENSYHLLSHFAPREKIVLVDGYWETVLTDELAKQHNMGPALYIDIDGDIYTSALHALDFVFRNKIVQPGTLIGYDDWGTPGHKTFQTGESRAHKEITEKHNVQWHEVFSLGSGEIHVQKLFQVKSYGA